MEGPGGYQFVGRTVQMWNTFHSTTEFPAGTPWLLRFFDELRFYPVSAQELQKIREGFPRGRYPLRIEPREFRLREYHAFLKSIKTEAEAFKTHQQAAFEAERERWAAAGQAEYIEPPEATAPSPEADVPEGCSPVRSPISASVWNVAVEAGQRVEAGQKLMILEAMKTEIAVTAPRAGIVHSLACAAGALVWAGQTLLLLAEGTA
jgi:urea carboxylase